MAEVTMRRSRSWSFEIQRTETDDWPISRPQPYSRAGRRYRPQRVRLSLSQTNDGPISLSSGAIYGPRYLKDGKASGAVVTETAYASMDAVYAEPWFANLVVTCQALAEGTL